MNSIREQSGSIFHITLKFFCLYTDRVTGCAQPVLLTHLLLPSLGMRVPEDKL